MLWDGIKFGLVRRVLCDVSEGYLAEVLDVGPPGVFVPFACEDAAPADLLTSHTKSANSGKEVNEGEVRCSLLFEGDFGFCVLLRYLGLTLFCRESSFV